MRIIYLDGQGPITPRDIAFTSMSKACQCLNLSQSIIEEAEKDLAESGTYYYYVSDTYSHYIFRMIEVDPTRP